jgi:hypothetical protein
MSPTRRQLKGLIAEIRREDIFLDQAGDAILSRWEDDKHALDALKDILARAEKGNGRINAFDIDAFLQLVLKIKLYAERADRLVKLRREIKSTLPKRRTVLSENLIRLGFASLRQNHHIIRVDACNPALAWNVRRRLVQAAMSA